MNQRHARRINALAWNPRRRRELKKWLMSVPPDQREAKLQALEKATAGTLSEELDREVPEHVAGGLLKELAAQRDSKTRATGAEHRSIR